MQLNFLLRSLCFSLTIFCTAPAVAISASTADYPGAIKAAPLPSEQRVMNFASEAALATFSFGFNDIQQKLPALAEYFSADAWQKYYDTLKKTGQIDRIISNEFLVRASLAAKPKILSSARDNSDQTWLIQVPVFVQYVSARDKVSGNINITMSVIPAPQKTDKGLEIQQIIVETVDK